MKTYIVILIIYTVFIYGLASDYHKGHRSKNNDEIIVLTPDFENDKPLNLSTAENKGNVNSDNKETTPSILCAICDPTVNLKGDECPKGYSRADDNTCQLEE